MKSMHQKHRRLALAESDSTALGIRNAFTLIELVVSVGAGTILMAGLMSTMFMATQTLNPPDRVADVLDGSKVAFDVTDELRYAIHVTDRSNTMIEFAVADRSGDGQADVIRYEWSGTAGDPLTRTFNRFRAANVGGAGVFLWFNAENVGNECVGLCPSMIKPDANTQLLRIGEYINNYRWDKFYSVGANDFVDLRLVVNPASDTYSVFIDGVFMDTFVYQGGYTEDLDAWAWLYCENTAGESGVEPVGAVFWWALPTLLRSRIAVVSR